MNKFRVFTIFAEYKVKEKFIIFDGLEKDREHGPWLYLIL